MEGIESNKKDDMFVKSGRSVCMRINLDDVTHNVNIVRSLCKNRRTGNNIFVRVPGIVHYRPHDTLHPS